MISKFEISNVGDAAQYHDKAFTERDSTKADNYYLNEQASAHWEGKGAELLGLDGKAVVREDFVAFLEGKLPNPANGRVQDLADNARGADRRAGVDFTVAPPKSVSVMALVGGDERIVAAHLVANKRAMSWLEENASVVRVRFNGNEPTPMHAGNLLYATVLHETDRSNQPQLHNHNVIVAAVYDEHSKKWRSLTNDQLYLLRADADVVYKTTLAREMRQAGYELNYANNNVDFEIAGFSEAQINAYSKRSEQIKKALEERGLDPENASWEARQTAALDSRAPKGDVSREELQLEWRRVAEELDLGLSEKLDTARSRSLSRDGQEAAVSPTLGVSPLEANRSLDAHAARTSAMQAVTWAVEHLSEREQSFKHTDLAIAALKFDRTGVIGDVEWAIHQHVLNGKLVPRDEGNGMAKLFTTADGIKAERELMADIRDGIGKGRVVMTDLAEFDASVLKFNARKSAELGSEFKLSAEQVTAARNLLMHPDTYQGVQGSAGTGKTAVLEFVREMAEGRGWQVMGMATSSSAAKELEASSGIASQTVAAFFRTQDNEIRATKLQIAELERALAGRGADVSDGGLPRIERQKLRVESGDVSFEESRYTFDHQRGEVFKSRNSFGNLIGNFFLDAADSGRSALDRESAGGAQDAKRSVTARLRIGALQLGAGVADFLGQHMTSFEQVGFVEAALARSTLYLSREPSQDRTVRELELKRAELFNLKTTGNAAGRKTLLVMDESSQTGAKDSAKVSALARSIGARVDFQGDENQHGSVPAGRAFSQALRAGMNTSILQETRRFDNATDQVKSALAQMKVGNFRAAIDALDRREVDQAELAVTVAKRYVENISELTAKGVVEPRVGIVAVTNADRKAINAAVHDLFAENDVISKVSIAKRHLDDPKLTPAEQTNVGMLRNANVDRLVFRQNYREIGVKRDEILRVVRFDVDNNRIVAENARGRQVVINPMKQERFTPAREESRSFAVGSRVEARAILKSDDKLTPRVANGTRGIVEHIDDKGAVVKWSDGVRSNLTNEQLHFVDHAYARTSFKEQGATNHREIIALSMVGAKVFNREAAYVAASRAKDNTEIVTSDVATMLRNAGRDVTKTTAVDVPVPSLEQIITAQRARMRELTKDQVLAPTRTRGRTISF